MLTDSSLLKITSLISHRISLVVYVTEGESSFDELEVDELEVDELEVDELEVGELILGDDSLPPPPHETKKKIEKYISEDNFF